MAGSRFAAGVLLALGYHVRYHGHDNIRKGAELRAIVLFNHMAFVSPYAPLPPGPSLHASSDCAHAMRCGQAVLSASHVVGSRLGRCTSLGSDEVIT